MLALAHSEWVAHTSSTSQGRKGVGLMATVLTGVLRLRAPFTQTVLSLAHAEWVAHTSSASQSGHSIGRVATIFTVNVSHYVT